MQQRKSSARHKAVTDTQRGAAVPPAGRPVREIIKVPVPPPSRPGSGEMTLGGHVGRGLTLAALYDTGVLERLRLDVRLRLLSDLTQSLALLHANPRLMASHPHLVINPSTTVIGLDGVARVDVRAAKKLDSEREPSELDYVAPEVASGDPAADLRADIYSLGVLAWEALAGKRISAPDVWSSSPGGGGLGSDVPAALGSREREPLRRKSPAHSEAKPSHSRLRAPPPISLPEGAEWAMPLAALTLQALCGEPGERPKDCRQLLQELELIATHLAMTHEIAEVVQGISAVDTLCVPLPTLPDVDAVCQTETTGGLGFMDRQPCNEVASQPICAQRHVPVPRRVEPAPAPKPASVPPVPMAAVSEPDVSKTVRRLREISSGSSVSGWFIAGLLSLAVLGLLAGYALSIFAIR